MVQRPKVGARLIKSARCERLSNAVKRFATGSLGALPLDIEPDGDAQTWPQLRNLGGENRPRPAGLFDHSAIANTSTGGVTASSMVAF